MVVTPRRAIAFSPLSSGFVPFPLTPGEDLERSTLGDDSVTLILPHRILIFREGDSQLVEPHPLSVRTVEALTITVTGLTDLGPHPVLQRRRDSVATLEYPRSSPRLVRMAYVGTPMLPRLPKAEGSGSTNGTRSRTRSRDTLAKLEKGRNRASPETLTLLDLVAAIADEADDGRGSRRDDPAPDRDRPGHPGRELPLPRRQPPQGLKRRSSPSAPVSPLERDHHVVDAGRVLRVGQHAAVARELLAPAAVSAST